MIMTAMLNLSRAVVGVAIPFTLVFRGHGRVGISTILPYLLFLLTLLSFGM